MNRVLGLLVLLGDHGLRGYAHPRNKCAHRAPAVQSYPPWHYRVSLCVCLCVSVCVWVCVLGAAQQDGSWGCCDVGLGISSQTRGSGMWYRFMRRAQPVMDTSLQRN
jgi:hypothetical protein